MNITKKYESNKPVKNGPQSEKVQSLNQENIMIKKENIIFTNLYGFDDLLTVLLKEVIGKNVQRVLKKKTRCNQCY